MNFKQNVILYFYEKIKYYCDFENCCVDNNVKIKITYNITKKKTLKILFFFDKNIIFFFDIIVKNNFFI